VGDKANGEEEIEEHVHGGVHLVNENFVTRSGRRVGTPRKYVICE
jgi:hypothetical protein